MSIARKLRERINHAVIRFARRLEASPVDAYGERTMMYVPQADSSQPNAFLLDLALRAIEQARDISLAEISARRKPNATDFPDLWPGEHYRLLAALVLVLRPLTVVEIGTYHGLSALALMKFLPELGREFTFDIRPWSAFSDTCLRKEDFLDGRLVQILGNLRDDVVFDAHHELLAKADLIFLDAPKDGIFERRFLGNLAKLGDAKPKTLVFDDIKTWKMLAIWREITLPKLDLTSFGHWTGTGLVHWTKGGCNQGS
jgi:predicted O-methyltransferase YrrM